jgi:hypothetical protein
MFEDLRTMKTRRDFVKLASATAVLSPLAARAATPGPKSEARSAAATGADDRGYWRQVAGRLAAPMLTALAERKLRATMPVESHPSSKDRPQYTHLEGFGRLLAGIAPWLELGGDGSAEGRERGRFADLARAGIDAGTDPQSPDYFNFSKGRQPLVDAAFLAQAMLRAPVELWRKLDARVQKNVVAALISTRPIPAGENSIASGTSVMVSTATARSSIGITTTHSSFSRCWSRRWTWLRRSRRNGKRFAITPSSGSHATRRSRSG